MRVPPLDSFWQSGGFFFIWPSTCYMSILYFPGSKWNEIKCLGICLLPPFKLQIWYFCCLIFISMPHFDTHTDIGTLALLKFKDFIPEQKTPSTWKSRGQYEPLSYALQTANTWILQQPDIELLNVETVVLPNIHNIKEEGSQDPDLFIGGGMSTSWHQFFRVWYIERNSEQV